MVLRLLLLLLLAGEAAADGFGAVAGLDVVDFQNANQDGPSRRRLRPVVGAFYRIEHPVMLDIGVSYARRRVDSACSFTECAFIWTFDDLEVPVVLRVPLVARDEVRILAHAAVVPWIVLRKSESHRGETEELGHISSRDVALAAGLGADWRLGHMRYGLEVRASMGLMGRTTSEYRDAHGTTYAGYLLFSVMRER